MKHLQSLLRAAGAVAGLLTSRTALQQDIGHLYPINRIYFSIFRRCNKLYFDPYFGRCVELLINFGFKFPAASYASGHPDPRTIQAVG